MQLIALERCVQAYYWIYYLHAFTDRFKYYNNFRMQVYRRARTLGQPQKQIPFAMSPVSRIITANHFVRTN